MTCSKCKKYNVCIIQTRFVQVTKTVYPWWETTLENIWDFVYEHCTQAELKDTSIKGE